MFTCFLAAQHLWASLLHWCWQACVPRNRRNPAALPPSLSGALPTDFPSGGQPGETGPHMQTWFSPESRERGAGCAGPGRALGSHTLTSGPGAGSSHSRRWPCPSCGAALLKPFHSGAAGLLALQSRLILFLAGCSLTSSVSGYCCGLNCLP